MKKLITDHDKLKRGECICVIKNKSTGKTRKASASVAKFPYTKDASKEVKKKYGKNIVYVCYTANEDVVGYYQ